MAEESIISSFTAPPIAISRKSFLTMERHTAICRKRSVGVNEVNECSAGRCGELFPHLFGQVLVIGFALFVTSTPT
jgi:hypothetical protein